MNPVPLYQQKTGIFGGAASTAHEGALSSRYRTSLPLIWFDSIRTQTPQTRRTLLSNGRYVFNNVPFIRPAFNELVRHTVPLRPRSLSTNREWAKTAQQKFATHARRLDYAGQMTFADMQRMVMISSIVDGDIGSALVSDSRGWPKSAKFGTGWPRVQLIRSHRIGGAYNNDPEISDGVKLDAYGEPISYRVFKNDCTYDADFQDVPARALRLVFKRLWPDQVRGLSLLSPAINEARDAKDLLDFEKVSNKKRTAIAGIVETDEEDPDVTQGGPFGDSATKSYTDASGNQIVGADGKPVARGAVIQQQFQGGEIPHMPRGWKFHELANDQPSTVWQGFLDTLIGFVVSTTDLPPEFLYNAGKISGPYARLIIQKVGRVIEEWQRIMVEQWLDDVWLYVIGGLIGAGELEPDPEWMLVAWQGPRSITIDVGREQAQDRADLFAGRRTEALDCGESGEDDNDHAAQLVIEAKRRVDSAVEVMTYANAKGAEMSFESAMQQIRANVQATGATPSAPQEPQQPTEGGK